MGTLSDFGHSRTQRLERLSDSVAGPLFFACLALIFGSALSPVRTRAQELDADAAIATAEGEQAAETSWSSENDPNEIPFASLQSDPDGVTWSVVSVPNIPGPAILTGVGFMGSPNSRELRHLSLQFGGGWVLWTSGVVASARGRMARYFGTSLSVYAGVDAHIRLDDAAAAHHLAFPARGLFAWSIGRISLLAAASLGPRWDIGSSRVGGQVAGGVGAALLLPPVAIPLLFEAVYNFEGDLGGTWGLRASLIWPAAF